MAKTIRDEQLKLNVVINGDKAKAELFKLEDANRRLKSANKELNAEKVKLERQGKKESQQYRELTQTIKANNAEIRQNESRMKQLRGEIGLTGLTFNQLSKRARDLRFAINNMTPGSAKRKEMERELAAINARMKQVRAGSMQTGGAISRISTGFNKFFGIIAAGTAALTGVIAGFRKLVNGSAELSDKLADVRKTTGLTAEEVRALDKELLKLNTRSSRTELLDLARIAGKLGVEGKENIQGFVRAADQINVALSEDLGGDAEEAIRQVGKLVDLFGVEDQFGLEQGLMKVGSAINSLGASSTANEGYLVNFTRRMGGVSTQADITVQDILGLGATLDQLGQTAEVSSTSLSKIMVDMFKDTADYATIAGMEVGEFTELLNTDANEAFIKMLEGLNGNNDGLSVMTGKLDDLGVDGSRAVGVLATLAKNTDQLREQQVLSNQEFEKGTSLTEEFSIKNETLAGTLSKIGKRLTSIFINSRVMDAIDWMVRGFGRLVGATKSHTDEMMDQQAEVNGLINAITSLNEGNKVRARLLDELQSKYGQYLSSLESEKATNEDLLNIQKQINAQFKERIRLAVYQEQITEIEEQTKQVFIDQEERIKNISGAYEKYIENQKEGATLEEKIAALMDQSQYSTSVLTKEWANLNDVTGAVTMGDIAASVIRNVKNNQDLLNESYEKENDLTEEYNSILNKRIETEGKLKEMNSDNAGRPGAAEGNTGNVPETSSPEDLEKILAAKQKALEDYYAAINNLKDQQYQQSLSKDEQELLAIDQKYQVLYEKADAAGQDTTDLQLQHAQELAAKIKEIEDEKNKEIAEKQKQAEKEQFEFRKQHGFLKHEELMQQEIDQFTLRAEQLKLSEEELQQGIQDIKDRYADEAYLREQAETDKILKLKEEEKQKKIELVDTFAQAASDITGTLATFYQAAMNRELAAAGDNEEKKEQIREKYAKKQQTMAVVQAIIDGAAGIVKTGMNLGFPLAIPFQVIQAAQTAAQIALIKSQQFASGKYDVIGADDGRTYRAGYVPQAATGIYTEPTMIGGLGLVGERGPELVVDGPTLSNMKLNAPELIEAIHMMRVPQYAAGNYSGAPASSSPSGGAGGGAMAADISRKQLETMIMQQAQMIELLGRDIRARVTYTEIKDVEDEIEDIKKSVSK